MKPINVLCDGRRLRRFNDEHACCDAGTGAVGTGPSFKGPLGLQLYSLRDQFAKDVPGTLDKVRDMGFTDVELAGTYGMSPEAVQGGAR